MFEKILLVGHIGVAKSQSISMGMNFDTIIKNQQ